MENLKIYNLHQTLINDIANSALPPGTVYFILRDILQEVGQSYQETIINEQMQQQENNNNE